MIEISLCMIVKDEEKTLARCLDSVKDLVDEIIIVDTGSVDRTIEIAKQYTDQIFSFPWIDDFAAARNFSFLKATKEYILWLDADDVLLEKDRAAFRTLKETLSSDVSMVMMRYNVAFDATGKCTFYYYRERLLRRDKNYRWEGAIHEVIPPSGVIQYVEIAVTHQKVKAYDSERNIRIFEKMIADGRILDRRQSYYYARELRDHGRYWEAEQILYKILDDDNTWVENRIDACRVLADCLFHEGKDKDALLALVRSFQYDIPRAEICCEIGNYFLKKQKYTISIYWYEQALKQRPNPIKGGFCEPDCYGYLPCIQLCVCYDRIGDFKKAQEYNEKAAQWKPANPSVLYNRNYFHEMLSKQTAAVKEAKHD